MSRLNFCLLGEPVFGFWLPYLAFEKRPCYHDGMPVIYESEHEPDYVGKTYDNKFLIFEWLGIDFAFGIKPTTPWEADDDEIR